MAVVALVWIARPTWHVIHVLWNDVDTREPVPEGMIDDASRLNRTRVAEVWPIPADSADAEAQLARLLARATSDGVAVSIAGARHTMGGHTIAADGIVIDM